MQGGININRIEVTFKSGKFVGFHDVVEETIEEGDGFLRFTHGEFKDIAALRVENIDFIEFMKR